MSKVFIALLILLISTVSVPAFSNSPPPDEDFAPWLSECKGKIMKAGGGEVAKQFSKAKPLTCSFFILPNGQPADIEIQLSSGNRKADDSVVQLIKTAAPFSQCPISPPDRSIGISFGDNLTIFHYQARLR